MNKCRPILRGLRWAVWGVVAMGFAVQAHAQARIESITSSSQRGAEVIRIELDQPLGDVPSGFVVQSPARIALDFPGVVNHMSKNTVDIHRGNLQSATVAQASDRTRVVLNLNQPTTWSAALDGNAVLITVDPVASRAATRAPTALVFAPPATQANQEVAAENHAQPASTAVMATNEATSRYIPPRQARTQSLQNIDFRRSTENAGRVVVDLPNDQVGVDIQQRGRNLEVEFLKTNLPEALRRRLDVADFGTPVQTITTSQVGDQVRMVIEPRGMWEHSAYQSDQQLVVEVREQKSDPDKLTQGRGFRGEKLSLNFQDVDVRSLLQVIADFTNFNIVTTDSVQGNLTLRLQDVPWDQALDIILQAKGLGMERVGNVLRIAPKEEMAASKRNELESLASIEELEPLRTQTFELNYTKAEELRDQLTDGGSTSGAGGSTNNRLLSDRGSVVVDRRTNQLFVTDIPSRLARVQEMISRLDVAVKQVLIEARIVEAKDTWGRSLGVKLGGADLRGVRGGDAGYSLGNNHRVAFGGNYNAITSTTGQTTGGLNSNTSQFVNLPAVRLDGVDPANFAISLFSSAANRFLNLELSALEADGKGKIVSSPRVVTANQTKAVIKQGTEIPYQEASSSGATSVSFKEAVLKLEVTPQITPEGNIILDLEVNKDSRGAETGIGGEPAIDTKQIKTQVLVENGGTVVIGGIFELNELDTVNKVPLLGDLPIMGHLFKERTRSSKKEEMMVFITPKIVTGYGGSTR